jgi:hypothetical protein
MRYDAARMLLHRLGRRVLNRSIHYHLFRHSSATYYADKMNRQQLCIRYSWAFSSRRGPFDFSTESRLLKT